MAGEVGGHVTGPAPWCPSPLVGLRGRMVDLEEPHPGSGQAPSPAVIPCTDHHHLADAVVEGPQHVVVEEAGAGGNMGEGPVAGQPRQGAPPQQTARDGPRPAQHRLRQTVIEDAHPGQV